MSASSPAQPLSARASRITRQEQTARDLTSIVNAPDCAYSQAQMVADTGATKQHVSDWLNPEGEKNLSVADARAISDDAVRCRVAQLIAGPAHAVVARVDAAAAPLDLASLAELSSSGSDFTVAALRALSDGKLTPAEERELLELVQKHEKRLASLRSALRSRVEQWAVRS